MVSGAGRDGWANGKCEAGLATAIAGGIEVGLFATGVGETVEGVRGLRFPLKFLTVYAGDATNVSWARGGPIRYGPWVVQEAIVGAAKMGGGAIGQ